MHSTQGPTLFQRLEQETVSELESGELGVGRGFGCLVLVPISGYHLPPVHVVFFPPPVSTSLSAPLLVARLLFLIAFLVGPPLFSIRLVLVPRGLVLVGPLLYQLVIEPGTPPVIVILFVLRAPLDSLPLLLAALVPQPLQLLHLPIVLQFNYLGEILLLRFSKLFSHVPFQNLLHFRVISVVPAYSDLLYPVDVVNRLRDLGVSWGNGSLSRRGARKRRSDCCWGSVAKFVDEVVERMADFVDSVAELGTVFLGDRISIHPSIQIIQNQSDSNCLFQLPELVFHLVDSLPSLPAVPVQLFAELVQVLQHRLLEDALPRNLLAELRYVHSKNALRLLMLRLEFGLQG